MSINRMALMAEASQWESMTDSEGWRMLCNQVAALINEERDLLETDQALNSITRRQGRISALREIIELPANKLSEIHAKLTEGD